MSNPRTIKAFMIVLKSNVLLSNSKFAGKHNSRIDGWFVDGGAAGGFNSTGLIEM